MGRSLNLECERILYYVITRGNERKRIFDDNKNRLNI